MKTKSFKAYIAEFIGTCVLVVFGCGTACAISCEVTGGYLATAIAFGLVIVAMAYSIGNISGCHINPAVSLAMLITKKLPLRDFIYYVIAQFLSAIAGAGILCIFFPASEGLGSNGLFENSIIKSLIIECILTFVFIFAILGVTSKVKNTQVSGIVIGLTLTLVHILGIHFTGTSVNPARSLGPAVILAFTGNTTPLSEVWVFIVAPLIGAAVAAAVFSLVNKEEKA